MNRLTVKDLALAGTVPSRQVLDMIRGVATDALKFDGEYDVQITMIRRLHDTLANVLGYTPPAVDGWFEIHFLHLMSLLDGQKVTEESGTRIGEEGKDWQAEIDELLPKLAGRPA